MKAFRQYHPFVLMVYFLSILLLTMFVWNPVMQLEALLYGVSIAVAVIAVMLWCKCYNEIMTSDKFLYLCGKAIPKLSLVLSMALRFIPMFKRQMKRVSNAQKTMGLYSSKSYTDRLRGSMRVFMAMLSWSFENAMDTAASMQARGYGLKGRTNFSMFRFSARDGVMLGAGLVAAIWTLIGAAASSVSFLFYPRITPVPHSLFAVSVYVLFAVLVFLPFMIEVKESVTWRYYISKI